MDSVGRREETMPTPTHFGGGSPPSPGAAYTYISTTSHRTGLLQWAARKVAKAAERRTISNFLRLPLILGLGSRQNNLITAIIN